MTANKQRALAWLAVFVAVAVFILDLTVELGVAMAVPYIAVIWVAHASGHARLLWAAAVVCSLLTITGLLFSPTGGEYWKVIANRVMALIAIWVTTILCRRVMAAVEEESNRAKEAEVMVRELAAQRAEDVRKSNTMMSLLDDLRIERRRLAASEQRTRLTIDTALDAVITIDELGLVTDWNPQAEETFGWTSDESIGKPLTELIIPSRYCDDHQAGLGRFRDTGEGPVLDKRLELTALRKNGEEFPIELAISPIQLEDGYRFSAFVRDITERLAAIRKIADREARITSLLDSTAEGIYGLDLEGNCTFANPACAELLGFDAPDAFLGKNMHDLIHHTRVDGSPYPKEQCHIFRAFRERRGVHINDEVLWRQDGSSFPSEYWSYPVEIEGELVGSVVTFLNITDRKELEETQRKLNEELEQLVGERTAALNDANEALAQSNVELQQFAYVASHDLQTPLRGISNFAQFLQADYAGKLDETADDYINRIVDGTKRMQALIRNLLQYSRVESQGAPLKPTCLNKACDDAIALLDSEIDRSVAEVTREELPTLPADPGQLTQLMQNLIGNAIKYRGDVAPQVRVFAERENSHWVVTVADNGIGIAPEHQERVFEIFRRLHGVDEYSGTGIGLAVCRRIVARHGGRIWVESTEGEGSRFRFTLPDEVAADQRTS